MTHPNQDSFESNPDRKYPEGYLLSTSEAAEYLSLSVPSIKYHVHKRKDLVPDKQSGRMNYFLEATLLAFKKTKRPAHRPKGSKDKKSRRK